MNPQPTIDAMRTAAQTLSVGDVREQLRVLQELRHAVDAAQAALLVELEASKDYELDGASTLNTWVRNQLRMNSGEANALVRGAIVARELPLVADAAFDGRISTQHVRAFVYGLKHVGLEPMRQHEDVLLAVALEHAPSDLFETIKHLKDTVHPEDLDDAWERGMDREDITVDAVPDGWHVTGFLNTVTGAKLKAVMDSVSAPRDKDDDRTGSQRRVQGLDDLLDSILASGLPSDKGVRPHLSVFVDANTVAAAADHVQNATDHPFTAPGPSPETKPAKLAGHGAIGPHLLMYLACIGDTTAFLTQHRDGQQAQILNAGRVKYEPTLIQRRAVLARQKGVCATPGCHHTHLEIHHTIWWSHGGPTDLDLLVGLCVRCHHLIHRGRLQITGNAVDGFEFATHAGRSLRRRRQTSYRRAA
ncbi:HNH endonuclease signature motif containing protein [Aeromicrobium sp. Root236]|uniref:HNH endonuclease n=1 Tax=Aeromicrobium sp. Root236 TaxID=1736498 RepID=UPI0012FAD7C7|nr:HNH endonuclease signature motif containing protein [Aeromicrobium sp. Root236]